MPLSLRPAGALPLAFSPSHLVPLAGGACVLGGGGGRFGDLRKRRALLLVVAEGRARLTWDAPGWVRAVGFADEERGVACVDGAAEGGPAGGGGRSALCLVTTDGGQSWRPGGPAPPGAAALVAPDEAAWLLAPSGLFRRPAGGRWAPAGPPGPPAPAPARQLRRGAGGALSTPEGLFACLGDGRWVSLALGGDQVVAASGAWLVTRRSGTLTLGFLRRQPAPAPARWLATLPVDALPIALDQVPGQLRLACLPLEGETLGRGIWVFETRDNQRFERHLVHVPPEPGWLGMRGGRLAALRLDRTLLVEAAG